MNSLACASGTFGKGGHGENGVTIVGRVEITVVLLEKPSFCEKLGFWQWVSLPLETEFFAKTRFLAVGLATLLSLKTC
jgi:hypothetical protein